MSAACSGIPGYAVFDVASNAGVADRLWLFSYGEMMGNVYPSAGFSSDAAKCSSNGYYDRWWLRFPFWQDVICVWSDGYWSEYVRADDYYKVAPGFTLS